MDNFSEIFNKYQDDYGKFEKVEKKFSKHPDIHAFLLLERLCSEGGDMISSAEHDEFYLNVDIEKLSAIITEEDILTLVRCGVMFDADTDSLMMFT